MILRSPIDHENGGFPFVARMEQGVIRVSSFTHAVASATPHATFLDSASLHPGYNAKAHPHAHYFQRRHRGRRVRGILNQNSFLRPSAPPRLATGKPEDLRKDSATCGSEQFQPCRLTGCEPGTSEGHVKISFILLNRIHNSRLSKNPPFPPFSKGGSRGRSRPSPTQKGDLEGFLICSTRL